MAHPVFTPTAVSPERLDEITVGRHELIARLVTRLRDVAQSGTRPHTLLVGPRGSGKTHLLGVVLHRATLDPAVDRRLAVAWIPEDALSIGSYEDLLVEVARALDASTEARARDLRRTGSASGLERLLLDAAGDRVLVLVLENLDRIFAAIGSAGQAALRGFVETSTSVVMLASTPLLFSAVSSRDKAWYGSFDAEHLGDLTLTEGSELLSRAAREAGDHTLADFIGSPTGQARLQAIEHLAGGSPRLWHILSGCVTIETLDELLPAVEALLDELAPYYQQRLWELPATEQKLVVELGRQQGSRTVTQLADAVGASNRVAATALGRLAEARWVRGSKVPGTDQRTTWYELREPLLRHHLQYRDARGEPLRFIVEFLSIWYAAEQRRRLLADAVPGSEAERHLVRTFLEGPPSRSDSAWANQDADQLLAEARCWIAGEAPLDRLSASPALGVAVEEIVLAARGSKEHRCPGQRRPSGGPELSVALRAAEEQPGGEAERVGSGLRALSALSWSADDADLAALMSTGWNGRANAAAARDSLGTMHASRADDDGLLSLAIRDEEAYWTGAAGDPAAGRDLYAAVIADRTRMLGPDHPDTLSSRHDHAQQVREAGDAAAARDLFAALVADRIRVLGPDDPDTLRSRHQHAYLSGEADDAIAARDLFAAVAADRARLLGPDHPDTLRSRSNHAYWTGAAGDAAAGRDLYAALVADCTRVLGPDHPNTLRSRHNHGYLTGKAGDAAAGRDLYATLVADCTRVLGPDRAEVLGTQKSWLLWTMRAGSDVREIAALLGPNRFAGLAWEVLLDHDIADVARIHDVVDQLPQGEGTDEVVLSAALAGFARPPGWRAALLRDLVRRVTPGARTGVLSVAAAFQGDPRALAELPAELRPIVQWLIELDTGDPGVPPPGS